MVRLGFLLIVGLTLAGCSGSSDESATPAWGTEWSEPDRKADRSVEQSPVALDIIYPPTPVAATDKKTHLTFEVLTVNVTPVPLTVDQVTVAASSAPAEPLRTYRADQIGPNMNRVGDHSVEINRVLPGEMGVFFVDLVLEPSAAVPAELIATVAVTADMAALPVGGPTTVPTPPTSLRIPVFKAPVPVISAPIAGDYWGAMEGCCEYPTHHRRGTYSVDGHLVIFERYAIDWLQLNDAGLAYSGPNVKENYFGYGADVLAVGDASVVSVVDGQPENVIGQPQPERSLAEAVGNHVVLDLGGNVYAVYAHLQPGSIDVRVGDKVKTGQVLGKLGNSGQSTAPHLHFHLMDNPNPVLSNPVPFVFDTLELVGRANFVVPEETVTSVDFIQPREGRTDEMPLSQIVVNFPKSN